MSKCKDVANAGRIIYDVLFKAGSFANVHDELLNVVFSFLEKSDEKRLLVLGPGPLGSPYHKRPKEFNRLVSGHKIVLLDYNVNNIAECFCNFNELGMLNGLDPKIVVNSSDSLSKMLSKKIGKKTSFEEYLSSCGFNDIVVPDISGLDGRLTFVEHNLRRPIPDIGKFDVVEASYTLHHISNYREIIQARVNEVYGCLRDKGLFHIGTGFADMTYSEKKIYSLGQDILERSGLDKVVVIDKRDSSETYSIVFEQGKNPKLVYGEVESSSPVLIDNEGYVYVPKSLANAKKGIYVEIPGFVVTPLIDKTSDQDHKGLEIPVYQFYYPTNVEIKSMKQEGKITAKLIDKVVEEDRLERHNAERGLVEYYMPENVWKELLSGFESVEVRRPNSDGRGFEDLVNIVAYK